MGEWVVSRHAGDVLTCIGLGSCIGLALLDRRACVAGLAHVMLPSAPPTATTTPGKYADLAVPELIAAVERRGGDRRRLEAVLVGGAQMFNFGTTGTGRDIGVRNEAAVREELARAGIDVVAAATGGSSGRSMKVLAQSGEVTCRVAAGATTVLHGAGAQAALAA